MIKLSPYIPYQEPISFSSFIYNSEKYNIFLKKGYSDSIGDRYFIQIYKDKLDGEFYRL